VALAEAILFVGRAVRVLRHPSPEYKQHEAALLPEAAMRDAGACKSTPLKPHAFEEWSCKTAGGMFP
jgi:hypothetical protein